MRKISFEFFLKSATLQKTDGTTSFRLSIMVYELKFVLYIIETVYFQLMYGNVLLNNVVYCIMNLAE